MNRATELAARIAARRARELAAWQAAYDALPTPTDHACAWCGDYAVRMARDSERIGWACERCSREAVPRVTTDMPRCPVVVRRTGLVCGAPAVEGLYCGWHKEGAAEMRAEAGRKRWAK